MSSAENFRKTRPPRPPPLPKGSAPDPDRAGKCPPHPSFLPQGSMTKNAAPSPRPARFRPQRRFPGRPVPQKARLPFPSLSPKPPSLSPRLFPGVPLPESLRRRAGKLSPRPLRSILSSAALPPLPRAGQKNPPASKEAGGRSPSACFSDDIPLSSERQRGETAEEIRAAGGLVIDEGTRARGWEDILMRRTENMLFFRRPARVPRRGSYRAWKYSRGCAQAGQDSGASRPSCT